jgi:copper transport protein
LLTLAALLVLAPATPAQAHSGLVSSSPAQQAVLDEGPATATLKFNENVSPVAASFQLYDPAGTKRQLQVSGVDRVVTVTLPGGLADGSYVLVWRVISADTHPIAGGLSFSVGEPGGQAARASDVQPDDRTVALVYLVAQIVAYLGLLAVVGLTLFEVLVLGATATVHRTRGRVLVLWALATVVGHAALLPLAALRGQGLPLDRLLDPALLTPTLRSAPALALALVVLGCVAMLLRPVLSGTLLAVVPAVGAALAVASVLPVGHARTTAPLAVSMGADVVHTLAGALWFGGVMGLGMFLRAAQRAGSPAPDAALTVRRFSGLAGLFVGALGVTGLVLGVLILGSVSSLVATNYGRTLLVKLSLVAVVGVLAWWNKTHLVPAVARAEAPERQWQRLKGAVRDEVAVLVAIICVTGLLVMQRPVATTEASPAAVPVATFESALGEGTVQGRVTPARRGVNTLDFEVRGADGAALSPLETPKVTASLPEAGVGPLVAPVRRAEAPGRYRAQITLPSAGQWQVAVTVRVDKFANRTARAVIPVEE